MKKDSGIGILLLIILAITATFIAVKYIPKNNGDTSNGGSYSSGEKPSDSSSGSTSDSSDKDVLYTITVPYNDVYTVSGDVSVKKGDTALVNIVPVEGYELTVKNGDEILTANNNQYKIENVSADITLTVEVGYRSYTITYYLGKPSSSQNKLLFAQDSEYGLSKQTGGSYPETYTFNTATEISNLKTYFECGGVGNDYCASKGGISGSQAGYDFKGWYLDIGCTIPFDGTIAAGTTGDITLFAAISMNHSHAY